MAAALSSIEADELRREAITQVPGCENGSSPIAVTPLQGGTSNATYRVQSRLGTFVMRFNDAESAALGVDRNREAVLHRAAAQAHLAPTLVYADARGRFLITEYISGKPWTAAAMSQPTRLKQIAHVLRQLHSLEAPVVPPLEIEPLIHRHARSLRDAQIPEIAQIEPLIGRGVAFLRGKRLRDAGGIRQACIVHGDLFHANLLSAGQRVYLLDWEYAAVTDPLFDLGSLLAFYPAASAHAALLLEESGLAGQASLEEVVEAAYLFTLLGYLWYRARRLHCPASSQDLEAEEGLRRRLLV